MSSLAQISLDHSVKEEDICWACYKLYRTDDQYGLGKRMMTTLEGWKFRDHTETTKMTSLCIPHFEQESYAAHKENSESEESLYYNDAESSNRVFAFSGIEPKFD
jgi:hypothetical protein